MKKDCIKREMTLEIMVGAFVLMILFGLAYFTIVLSTSQFMGENVPMTVRFKNVMGLSKGDSVVARGMTVGKVSSMDFNDKGDWVKVDLSLDSGLCMKVDYKITIVSTSILGGRYLQIDEGNEGVKCLPMNFDFVGEQPHDLMADFSELVNNAKTGIVQGHMIDNMVSASKDIKDVAHRVKTGQGFVGKLLSDDDHLYNDLASAVASIKEVANNVSNGKGSIGKLLSDNDVLYNDVASAAKSLNQIMSTINKGEGTIGKLVQDDSLYENVNGLVKETRATVDDYREASPVVTFTSVFFGAF